VHKNLSRVKELESNKDFKALGNLIQSLERVSALELGASASQNGEVVELRSVLDEFRNLIETSYHESEIEMHGDVREPLPLVWADRYGLIQVFLNLIAVETEVVALRHQIGIGHAETLRGARTLAFTPIAFLPSGENVGQVVLAMLVGGERGLWLRAELVLA
jgi:nitrogen-specific signal transduction histidine kinase